MSFHFVLDAIYRKPGICVWKVQKARDGVVPNGGMVYNARQVDKMSTAGRIGMKWKHLAMVLIIPMIVLSLLLVVVTLPWGSTARIEQKVLPRHQYEGKGILENDERLISLNDDLGLAPPVSLGQIETDHLLGFRNEAEMSLHNGKRQPPSLDDPNLTQPANSTAVIWDMLAEVDRDRAEADLRRLTGEETFCINSGCYTITHRLTGSDELGLAMDYLYENLITLNYTVEFQDWARSGYTDRNLIARKTGVLTPTEEIYLVSHVDGAKQSELPHPAADDNASSVVNGLELARVFSEHTFGRTIVIFFSTGEEQGMQGVRYYLEGLSQSELDKIKYVINRDVTGYDANEDAVMELGHGDHPPSIALAQVMSRTINTYQLDLDPHVIASCP
jgi:hypothetical protein